MSWEKDELRFMRVNPDIAVRGAATDQKNEESTSSSTFFVDQIFSREADPPHIVHVIYASTASAGQFFS